MNSQNDMIVVATIRTRVVAATAPAWSSTPRAMPRAPIVWNSAMTATATLPDSNETVLDTGTDELLCVIRERVAVMTLNRPNARNSLSDNLTPALRRMIKLCGEDPKVGALLITGAGDAFCAGGDIKGMGGKPGSSTAPEMTFDEKVARL